MYVSLDEVWIYGHVVSVHLLSYYKVHEWGGHKGPKKKSGYDHLSNVHNNKLLTLQIGRYWRAVYGPVIFMVGLAKYV